MPNQSKTLIVVVLDRSGSMDVICDDIAGGFNSFIEEQRKQPGECAVTLTQFDDKYEVVYNNKSIADVPKLAAHGNYVPRGNTALYDAVGRTINEVGAELNKLAEADRPGKLLFVIITDGQENASKEFAPSKVGEMIKHQQTVYQWQFTYLAATLADKQAHIYAAAAMHIPQSNIMRAAHTSKGSSALFSNLVGASNRYRSNLAGSGYHYTSQEQKDAEEADNE